LRRGIRIHGDLRGNIDDDIASNHHSRASRRGRAVCHAWPTAEDGFAKTR
jgi:hypothetical protein